MNSLSFSLLLSLLVVGHGFSLFGSKKPAQESGSGSSGSPPSLLQAYQQTILAPALTAYYKDKKFDELGEAFVNELRSKAPTFNDIIKTEDKNVKGPKGELDQVSFKTTKVEGLDSLRLKDVVGVEKGTYEQPDTYIRGRLKTGKIIVHGIVEFKKDIVDKTKYFAATAKQPINYDIRLKISSNPLKTKVIHFEKISPTGSLTFNSKLDDSCGGFWSSNKNKSNLCKDVNDYVEKELEEQFEKIVQERIRKIIEENN
jgi:hypothetical protein